MSQGSAAEKSSALTNLVQRKSHERMSRRQMANLLLFSAGVMNQSKAIDICLLILRKVFLQAQKVALTS